MLDPAEEQVKPGWLRHCIVCGKVRGDYPGSLCYDHAWVVQHKDAYDRFWKEFIGG